MTASYALLVCFFAGAYGAPQLFGRTVPQPGYVQSRSHIQYPQTYQSYPYGPETHYPYNPAPQVYRQPLIGGAAPRTAAILRQAQDVSFDGTYSYGFDSEDGISVQANAGPLTAVGPEDTVQTVTGTYSYIAPDGTPITTNWIADENGFRAEGAHLPKAPEGSIRIV